MDKKPLAHVTVQMFNTFGRKAKGRHPIQELSAIRRLAPLLTNPEFYAALHREWNLVCTINSGEAIFWGFWYAPPDPMDSENNSKGLNQLKRLPIFGWEQERAPPE